MIDYGLGVTTEETIKLQKLDEFAEPYWGAADGGMTCY